MKNYSFQLQFAPSRIRELSERYSYRLEDEEAMASGKRIARGEYTRRNLEAIFEWKTGGRGKSRLHVNTDEEIEDALRAAVEAKTERTAVSVLSGLYGIEIPVASAVLTAVSPERYTIIDYRALEALGENRTWHTVDSYLAYLVCCRRLARENGVSLRELDRALWQWSAERGKAPSGVGVL
jgi:thermostable 8-oxoguanine DNA glycosylase